MLAHTLSRQFATSLFVRMLALLVVTVTPFGAPLLAQSDATAGQQAVIEIVRLQHRDPSQIRAAITPLLVEHGSISQIDNNLIISTSRANLLQLEELITELDVPRRQLRISVDFRYGSPAVPRAVDDATLSTTLSTDTSQEAVQSIIVTEGEYAHFSISNGDPVGGLNFTEIAALLEQQRTRSTQSLSLTAQPRGNGVVLEIAALLTEPDQNGNPQTRVVNSTLEVGLNQWQVVSSSQSSSNSGSPSPGNIIATTATSASTAVLVEVLP